MLGQCITALERHVLLEQGNVFMPAQGIIIAIITSTVSSPSLVLRRACLGLEAPTSWRIRGRLQWLTYPIALSESEHASRPWAAMAT
jgi:hypothetical protein